MEDLRNVTAITAVSKRLAKEITVEGPGFCYSLGGERFGYKEMPSRYLTLSR